MFAESRDRYPFLPVVLVAGLYWLTGRLGLLVAIPPGFATPVWLASGAALAGFFMVGPRIWAGVFVGSVLVNLSTCLSSDYGSQNNTLTVLGIASGSTLQAWAGMWVTRRFLKKDDTLNGISAVPLVLIAVFGCCCIGATVGSGTLWMAERINSAAFVSNWSTWWLGDTLGVLFFAPVLFGILSKRRLELPCVISLFSIVATLLSWHIAATQVQRKNELRFNTLIDRQVEKLEDRMAVMGHALDACEGLIRASQSVERHEWLAFVDSLEVVKKHQEVLGYGFIQRVARKDVDSFLAQTRSDDAPDFKIHPSTTLDELFVIKFLSPVDRNRAAIGLDIAFEPSRCNAALLSMRTGRKALTAPIRLVQDSRNVAGMLLLKPVFSKNLTEDTESVRRNALLGWVYAPIVAEDLLRNSAKQDANEIGLQIYDITDAPETPLLSGGSENITQTAATTGPYLGERKINFEGRLWSLRFKALPAFMASNADPAPDIVLICGLFFSFLLAWLLLNIASTRERALALAAVMTADLRKTEAELRAVDSLKQTLSRAIEQCPVSVVITDSEGIIQFVNPFFTQLTGYTSEDAVGNKPSVLKTDKTPPERFAELWKTIKSGKSWNGELFNKTKEGREFVEMAHIAPVLDDKNQITHFVAVKEDITDRRRYEAELRAADRFKQTLFDAADYAIVSTTTDGMVTAFNRGAEQMLGYLAAEVVGKQTPAIWHDSSEVVKRAGVLTRELNRQVNPGFEVFTAKLPQCSKDENEWTFIRKDGSRFPGWLSVTAFHDDTGKAIGFLGVIADITERKKMDRMQSEFVSTVSHELRTPLTSIRGSLGLVAGGMAGELTPDTKELVDIALNNCDRLVRLINDILDIEKIQSGRIEFRLKTVNLSQTVRQALTVNDAFAAAHRAKLALVGEPASGEVSVDEDRLMQVLTNLISNAAKFSPPGGVVELSVVESNERLRVNVRDHGTGIPDEFKGRIFQRFSQADSSDTRQKGGTGLGLSISKAIIEQLGGRIDFEPAEGGGTCFFFELPRVRSITTEPASDSAKPSEHDGRVLVCEDDPDTATVLSKMLTSARLTAHVAPSIQRARELLAQFHYRAVTLDLTLSDGDGCVLIGEMRANPRHANTPIIVLTGMGEEARAHLGGAVVLVADILVKPIDEPRLLNAIRAATTRVVSRHPRLLHVEDDADLRWVVKKHLPENWEVFEAGTLATARTLLEKSAFDVVLLDLGLPDGGGETLLDSVGRAQVIIFSASDVSSSLGRLVNVALTKSHTNIEELCETILALVPRDGDGNNIFPK